MENNYRLIQSHNPPITRILSKRSELRLDGESIRKTSTYVVQRDMTPDNVGRSSAKFRRVTATRILLIIIIITNLSTFGLADGSWITMLQAFD